MNILDKIVANKKKEVERAKQQVSIHALEQRPFFSRKSISIKSLLQQANQPAIISEFKRRSPSKGIINAQVTPAEVTRGYVSAGAAALSVLTDQDFFGGNFDDFLQAREANPVTPMLRKDFIVDRYQLWESKAIGADFVLLIAACLTPAEVKEFSQLAHQLGMEVLLEVHDEDELQQTLCDTVDIVGVNNRNLKNFVTDIDVSLKLSEYISDSFVKISESGLKNAETLWKLYEDGYKGFLIGETFMKTDSPASALTKLQDEIVRLRNYDSQQVGSPVSPGQS